MKIKPRSKPRSEPWPQQVKRVLGAAAAKDNNLAAFAIYGVIPGRTPKLMFTVSIPDNVVVIHHLGNLEDIDTNALIRFCNKHPSQITGEDIARYQQTLNRGAEDVPAEASAQLPEGQQA